MTWYKALKFPVKDTTAQTLGIPLQVNEDDDDVATRKWCLSQSAEVSLVRRACPMYQMDDDVDVAIMMARQNPIYGVRCLSARGWFINR